MKKRYILFTVLGLCMVFLIFYRINVNKSVQEKSSRGAHSKNEIPSITIPVKGIIVIPQDFLNTLSVTGSIQANQEIQLRGEVSGIVRKIYFEEGSKVRKGEPLVKISDSELQAQLVEALTKQKLATQSEYRSKMLLNKEAISAEEYEIAQADLESLKSRTQLIRAQIARTLIVAPFSGRVGLKNISVGGYITPSTIIANLVNTSPIKLVFSVPEKYSSLIKVNTGLHFSVAGSKKIYSAKIYAIEPNINITSRTLEIAARAANSTNELIPGAFAKIDLPLSKIENAILIPTEAIIPIEKGKKVFVNKNGIAKEVMIETATRTNNAILVTAGLTNGDTVLTSGMMALKEDSPIKVTIVKNK